VSLSCLSLSHQNVDYETFKNMVSVAHLKPIQAKAAISKAEMIQCPSWAFSADGVAKANEESISAVGSGLHQDEPSTQPSSSGDFAREWRRGCPTDDSRYRYLRLTTPELISSIFRVEISTDLLREILTALDSSWMSHAGAAEDRAEGAAAVEASFVIQCLQALTIAGRFSLTIRLIGSKGKETLSSLFKSLQDAAIACGSDQVLLVELASRYGVQVSSNTSFDH
jgi:hypothetical protein